MLRSSGERNGSTAHVERNRAEFHQELSRQLFGGEDLFDGDPWWHQVLSDQAAEDEGFSSTAAERIAWHADYTDRLVSSIALLLLFLLNMMSSYG